MSRAPEKPSVAGEPTPEVLARKIPDGDLRELADDPTADTAAVIIELELPRRTVEFLGHRQGDRGVALPVGVTPASSGERETVERTTEEATRFLRELLGEDPVHLRSARAFSVKARGEHLKAIASQPWARRIRHNRALR